MNLRIFQNILTIAMISKQIAQRKAAIRFQRIAAGIAILFASWALAIIGVIGAIGSLFFALSHVSQFAYASAVTGGISILIAILLAIEGIRLIKK